MTTKQMPKLEFVSVGSNENSLSVIIAAAGHSRRMGTDKILMELMGQPVILHTIRVFQNCPAVSNIIVVANEENICDIQKICSENNITKLTDIVLGGSERLESVKNGFERVRTDYVAIHDGARPLVTDGDIQRVFDEAQKHGGAIAGAPVKCTVKTINEDGFEVSTPARRLLFEAHTPQIFDSKKYGEALKKAVNDRNTRYTDDAMVFANAGFAVKTVDTGYENIKITTVEDILLSQQILMRRNGL